MNLYNNSNRMEKDLQEVMEKWNKKILSHRRQQEEQAQSPCESPLVQKAMSAVFFQPE